MAGCAKPCDSGRSLRQEDGYAPNPCWPKGVIHPLTRLSPPFLRRAFALSIKVMSIWVLVDHFLDERHQKTQFSGPFF
jgi:hypothetical protein